ncbi:outer membrane protein [Falsiroseomonas sp. CW058]|uniref:outer membrane protein n=1 Tax=Falsiroseomonas sp. CW058 TaxID=3388664 RepID=UPI003D310F55
MRRHLIAAPLAVALSGAAGAQPLSGAFIGPAIGHMQSGATVRFAEAGRGAAGQINDVSGNTILPGLYAGVSRAVPGGVFYGIDVFGFLPAEPYPSTIVQFAGREYVVSNRAEAGAHLRLGYSVRDDAAIYATAGVSVASVRYVIDGVGSSRLLWHPQIGVGAEIALAPRVSLRGDFVFDRTRRDLGPVDVEWQVRWRASTALVWRP